MPFPYSTSPKKKECICIVCDNTYWTITPDKVTKCTTCRSKPGFYRRKDQRTLKVTEIFKYIKLHDFDYDEVKDMDIGFEFKGGKVLLVAR